MAVSTSVLRDLHTYSRSTMQISTQIGRGSFGAVYKCTINGEVRALKELNTSNASIDRQWLLERLRKEISMLHRVSTACSAFVRIYANCVNADNILCGYVMEFCEFGNLRSVFNRVKVSNVDCKTYPWLAIRFLYQVAIGLRYLQEGESEAILHNDVAIDNILIDANFNAKLGDFGLARSLTENVGLDTRHFESLVGIERRPPELLVEPLRAPDVYVDRYLFGICLYEALTCSSLRHKIGSAVSDYRTLVVTGAHVNSLTEAVDRDCFTAYPARLKDETIVAEDFKRMRSDALNCMRRCLDRDPITRPSFTILCEELQWSAQHDETSREASFVLNLLHPEQDLNRRPRTGQNDRGGAVDATSTTQDNLDSMLEPRISTILSGTAVFRQDLGYGGSIRVGVVKGKIFDPSVPVEPLPAEDQPVYDFALTQAPRRLLMAIFRSSVLLDNWPRLLEALGAQPDAVNEAALAARRAGRHDADAAMETLERLMPNAPTVKELADGLVNARCSAALPLLDLLQAKYGIALLPGSSSG